MELGEEREISYVELREQIARGQRVTGYRIMLRDSFGIWRDLTGGATIGHKQINPLAVPGHSSIKTDAVKVLITGARDRVEDIGIAIY